MCAIPEFLFQEYHQPKISGIQVCEFRITNLELRIMNDELGNNGFTLIEVLVVMGILAILSTMGYLVAIDFYKSYAFNAERDTIVSLLQKARAASLSNINQSPHGVYFDDTDSQYVVFQGPNYAGRNQVLDQSVPYAPGITRGGSITNTKMIFQQLTGNALKDDGTPLAGNVILSEGNRLATISLNNLGQINW